jgi:tetratricopeptide (TPR) repeat protein
MIYNTYFPAAKQTTAIKPVAGNTALKLLLMALAAAGSCVLVYRAYSMYAADVAYNRGKIIGSVYNKWDASIEEHRKSIQMEPYEVKYHVYLGLAYERLAGTLTDKTRQVMAMESAVAEYKKGIELNPGNAYYWGNLGRAYASLAMLKGSQQDFDTAVKYYQTAIDRAPVTGLFYNNLIELYTRSGMPDKALPLLAKLEALDKKLAAGAYFMLGNGFFGSKDLVNAEKAYIKTIELDPEIFQAYHNLGVVYAATKNKVQAVYYLEKFIQMAPTSDMVPNAEKILKNLK